MRLIIAEKPSVAQSIAAILGAGEHKEGYLQGNGYLVSWCLGHLVELAPPDCYNGKYRSWRYEDLPILPSPWHYIVPKDKQKQFKILSNLMNDKSVESLICATDAGREGELIFRLVYHQAGCKKPVQRLWINSMEDSAIRGGFSRLCDCSLYDRLYQSALCRAQADWIIGINATRLYSVLYKQTLNIGRVMTPTLAMIVNRGKTIKNFTPENNYIVVLDCGGFSFQSDKQKDHKAAKLIKEKCNGKPAVVKGIDRREQKEMPPKLYDLTTLQRDANRMLDFTAQQTLDYAQSLYEKKLITYPRTDSRYLTTEISDAIPNLIKVALKLMSFIEKSSLYKGGSLVVNNSKVSDHHAIIPTATLFAIDPAKLPTGEIKILELIALRLLCAVGEPHVFTESKITVECAGQNFSASGKTIRCDGWKAFNELYQKQIKEDIGENQDVPAVPSVESEQRFEAVKATLKQGKTTPPKYFTEDTLLLAMETAGSESMPEDAERKGLGTPATRAGILEKLIRTQLVERQGKRKLKVLIPTSKGEALINTLPEVITSPKMTADWEYYLKQVERGQQTPDSFLDEITRLAAELVKTCRSSPKEGCLFQSVKRTDKNLK